MANTEFFIFFYFLNNTKKNSINFSVDHVCDAFCGVFFLFCDDDDHGDGVCGAFYVCDDDGDDHDDYGDVSLSIQEYLLVEQLPK